MPEIGIVICVALILFLMLRNYPKVPQEKKEGTGFMVKFFDKILKKRREKTENQIIEAISTGQENIVPPAKIEEAQDVFATTDPEIAKLLIEAGEALNVEEYDRAEEKSIEAIAKDKYCDKAYVIIGLIAIKKGDMENARQAAEAALKCSDENGEAYAILGDISISQERMTEAMGHYQKAVLLDRSRADWYGSLGKIYFELRQFAKAAKALKRASMLDSDNREYKEMALKAEEKQRSHSQAFGK